MAEVLITLGIIGVVAALTAPALVKNSGQAKIGPSLAKFVNTVETACEQLMEEENVSSLYSVVDLETNVNDAGKFLKKLSNYMIMTPVNKSYTFKNADGTNITGSELIATVTNAKMQLKDGSLIANAMPAPLIGINLVNNYVGPYKKPYMFIVYDINGYSGNSIAGRETFAFILDSTGIMVPIGSNASKNSFTSSFATTECNPKASNVVGGWACAGKIADNGWKADY